jgi:hypothetical protein
VYERWCIASTLLDYAKGYHDEEGEKKSAMRALVDRNNAGRGLMQGANTVMMTNEKTPGDGVDGG